MSENLLEVKNLKINFKTYAGIVQAVRGVNFEVKQGETLCIVGESGSGKSVTSNALMKLIPQPPGIYAEGQILFDGRDLVPMTEKEMTKIRGNEIAMIFQDPMTALNPTMRIGKQIMEVILKHKKNTSKAEAKKRAIELIDQVGIPFPEQRFKQYPHEFSGGQRQRSGIAKALSLNPKFIVCDEPVSALDVSIQAQILNLLKELQQELALTLLFVGHGLGAVNYVSDRIAVMYLGKIVEIGEAKEIFRNPVHPYTRALLNAVPVPDPEEKQKVKKLLQGEIGNSTNPPSGCRFHQRCPYATTICSQKEPGLSETSAGSGHYTACPIVMQSKEVQEIG